MVDKSKSSNLYETFLEKTSNLTSRTLDTYENLKDNADEYKESAISGLKKTTVGLTALGMLAGATPALAEDNDKKVTVPIGQVMQSKEDCQLSASQLTKEEVEVLEKCVSEDYLSELEYEHSTEDEDRVTKGIEKEELPDGPEDIDEFWLGQYDGDDRIEGVFVDNQSSAEFQRALIGNYPFGEDDGDIHDTMYEIEGGEVVEVRAGDMDGDGIQEIALGVNTTENRDNALYTQDFDVEKQELNTNKYPAPTGKKITDVQVVGGRPRIATNDVRGNSDFEFDFYELNENGEWEELYPDNLKNGIFKKLIEKGFRSFHPKAALWGNWDSDPEYELIATDGKSVMSLNGSQVATHDPGSRDWIGDMQEANFDPFDDENEDILYVPDVRSQEIYNQGNAEGVVTIRAAASPDSNSFYTSNEAAYLLHPSGQIFTDVQMENLLEHMQPPGAEDHIGSDRWLDFWGPKYRENKTGHAIFPVFASTTNKLGSGKALFNTSSWRFNPDYNVQSDTDFDFGKYKPWTQDSDRKTLE